MTALLDVNVLIALAWPNHVHHDAARAWFDQLGPDGWATCPFTEAGFVRVSCNQSVVGQAVTPQDAIAVLDSLTRLGVHDFWPVDQPIMRLPESVAARLQGYRQITDANLLMTAMQRGGQLATLDSGMEDLLAEDDRSSLCVIPV
ncbi:MAG: PIN domain-containing protein [Chloroflexota bacterium]|nr:PIN domain-containing protein [Chloroflexota bacterium]